MSGDAHNPINRRDFLRSGTAAVVAANIFGFHPAHVFAALPTPPAAADATELMKSAAAGIHELNASFTRWAREAEKAKAMLEEQKHHAAVMAVVEIIIGIIMAIISIVVATVSFGSGASLRVTAVSVTSRLNLLLASLAKSEAEITAAGLMGASIGASIANVRQIVADVKDAVIARDIFFRLSQDRAYASSVLEALRTGKRSAAEEMLKRDVAGSSVTLQTFNVASAVNLSVRINNFVYCLSTASACSGRQLTFRR